MNNDKEILKSRLRDFINACGIEIDTKEKPHRIQCPNPNHADGNPSGILYSENIHCPVCAASYDIFEVAGFIAGVDRFPEKVNYVRQKLGMVTEEKRKEKIVPLTEEKANQVYRSNEIQRTADKRKWGKLTDVWYYKNKGGLVLIADIRFENEKGKKSVISFFYNGNSFRYTNTPIYLFNLDRINKDNESKILICEGAKCAIAADGLSGFIGTTWNGGSSKAKQANWSTLKGREVYIYPDDDKPGIKAALAIKKFLPDAKIVKPLSEARKIKQQGADIIEALQCMSIDELAEYIINSDPADGQKPKEDKLTFRILGTGSDERAHFVDSNGRLFSFSTTSVNKTQLMNLAPLGFWKDQFGFDGKTSWDNAIDWIITTSNSIDFSDDLIRGRGAWKEQNGDRCYHAGVKTIGKKNPNRHYERKPAIDIGLNAAPADKELARNMSGAISSLSFETPLDCIRLLGWVLLAPFCGMLPWRPAILVTGESQSGKSTLIEQVVKPIALPLVLSGGGSTEAGVRQKIGNDATSVVIDEAEADTKKKKRNREDLFSLMRQSTSDDAPAIAKGTVTGKAIYYQMRSMFLFAAISPDIEHSADDNRILRVNMIVANNEWKPIREKIRKYIIDENCKRIRSLTWKNIDQIVKKADDYSFIIQDITSRNIRACNAESLLQSAYWNIWKGIPDMSDKEAEINFSAIYRMEQEEDKRDEPDEMINRILDEKVFVESPSREMITLREILLAIKNGEVYQESAETKFLTEGDTSYFKSVAARYGLSLAKNNSVAIASNHYEIMKILERGKGYHRQLWRHRNVIDKSAVMKMAGKSRRCVLISDVLE